MYQKAIENVYKRLGDAEHMYLIHVQVGWSTSAEVDQQRPMEFMFEEPVFAHETDGLTMGATYRLGGVSQAPYNYLNLAFHVGDQPEAVKENRAIIADYLGVSPSRITNANQVHGLNVVEVTRDNVGAGAFDLASAIQDTDALMTREKDIPLFLFTADCVAIGIYDPVHQVIAVVHAGWKGTIGHLPAKTIHAMAERYGTKAEDCQVFLGPSISPDSFEVNQELADRFSREEAQWSFDDDALAEVHTMGGQGLSTESVVSYKKRPGVDHVTPHVDLWTFNVKSLVEIGVKAEHITVSGTDSMTEPLCYSYRREEGRTGRMALFAMLHSQDTKPHRKEK